MDLRSTPRRITLGLLGALVVLVGLVAPSVAWAGECRVPMSTEGDGMNEPGAADVALDPGLVELLAAQPVQPQATPVATPVASPAELAVDDAALTSDLASDLATALVMDPVMDPVMHPAACDQAEAGEGLVDCGSQWSRRADEPVVVTLLRDADLRTTEDACTELLTDLWSRQACAAEGRECGSIVPPAVPTPAPKLLSNGSSARSTDAWLSLTDPRVRRLGAPADEFPPPSRTITPPEPPPRLVVR